MYVQKNQLIVALEKKELNSLRKMPKTQRMPIMTNIYRIHGHSSKVHASVFWQESWIGLDYKHTVTFNDNYLLLKIPPILLRGNIFWMKRTNQQDSFFLR